MLESEYSLGHHKEASTTPLTGGPLRQFGTNGVLEGGSLGIDRPFLDPLLGPDSSTAARRPCDGSRGHEGATTPRNREARNVRVPAGTSV